MFFLNLFPGYSPSHRVLAKLGSYIKQPDFHKRHSHLAPNRYTITGFDGNLFSVRCDYCKRHFDLIEVNDAD